MVLLSWWPLPVACGLLHGACWTRGHGVMPHAICNMHGTARGPLGTIAHVHVVQSFVGTTVDRLLDEWYLVELGSEETDEEPRGRHGRYRLGAGDQRLERRGTAKLLKAEAAQDNPGDRGAEDVEAQVQEIQEEHDAKRG